LEIDIGATAPSSVVAAWAGRSPAAVINAAKIKITGRVDLRATKLIPDSAKDAKKLDAHRRLCYYNTALT
jgi:hypothetical protein